MNHGTNKKEKKKRKKNTVNGDYAQILSPHGLDKIRSDKIIILFTAVIYLFTHDSVIFFFETTASKLSIFQLYHWSIPILLILFSVTRNYGIFLQTGMALFDIKPIQFLTITSKHYSSFASF